MGGVRSGWGFYGNTCVKKVNSFVKSMRSTFRNNVWFDKVPTEINPWRLNDDTAWGADDVRAKTENPEPEFPGRGGRWQESGLMSSSTCCSSDRGSSHSVTTLCVPWLSWLQEVRMINVNLQWIKCGGKMLLQWTEGEVTVESQCCNSNN